MEIIVRITSRLLLTLAAGIFLISSVLQGQEAHQREVESAILAKAAQNIEKYRKGDVAIIFKKESGEAHGGENRQGNRRRPLKERTVNGQVVINI